MKLPEALENALSETRKQMGEEQVFELSLRTQTNWAEKSVRAGKDTEVLDKELDALDALSPVILLLVKAIYEDKSLLNRLFEPTESRTGLDKFGEFFTRSMLKLEKGIVLSPEMAKDLAEKVIEGEEPSEEVKKVMKELKEKGFLDGAGKMFSPWES